MSPSPRLVPGIVPGGTRPGNVHAVPRPQFRWATRAVLPAIVLFATAAMLAWAARGALWPRIEVRVVPAVLKPRSVPEPAGDGTLAPGMGAEHVIVQAPGWLEPSPFAVGVAALADGVVSEVLVLEGQEVAAGQVVARLVDEDARLSLRLAEAVLAERAASVLAARAEADAARARAAELRDEFERKQRLTESGGVASAQVGRLELRLRGIEADVSAAAAALALAEASHATQSIAVEQAKLLFARMEVRAPVAGVVLTRMIEPGTRLAMGGTTEGRAVGTEVMRLYDPAHLQARVDVPLSDASKILVGTHVRIMCEALPNAEFEGEVLRIVHRANIERNTVQFKVSVREPRAALKPEMLVRVKFMSGESGGSDLPGVAQDRSAGEGFVVLLDDRALVERAGASAAVWVLSRDRIRGETVRRQAITLGRPSAAGQVEVVSGFGPTDRVVIDVPPGLRDGARVRAIEDAPASGGAGND